MPTLDELKLLGFGKLLLLLRVGVIFLAVRVRVALLLAMEFVQITAIIFQLMIMGLEGDIGLLPLQSVLQPGDFTLNI